MPWQAADPGTLARDANGGYHVRVGDQWIAAPPGSIAKDDAGTFHYNSDAMAPPPAPPLSPEASADKIEQSRSASDHTVRNAALHAVGSIPGVASLENSLAGVTGGIGQLADTATGAPPGTHDFSYQPRTPQGQALQAATGAVGGAANHGIAQAGGAAVGALGGDSGAAAQTIEERLPQALGSVGTVLGAAGAPGLGRLAGVGERAAGTVSQGAQALGMRTAEGSPIARNVAGSSAGPALTRANQDIANPVLGAQAGVAPGTKLSPGSVMENARQPANSVYQRAAASLPTAPMSPAAADMLNDTEGGDDLIVHSPDTATQIDTQKQRLLAGPLTGSQVVNAQKALRFNGFGNVGSEDPERVALGRFQLRASDALHQHMVDTLPPDAPVSADQLSQARTALAQNHTIENALGPNGDVDLQKLAKLHTDNPGMLSGPMADIAQFAFDHPEVTRLPSVGERLNPSGVVKDVASVDLKRPISYVQPFLGTAARRALTGPARATPAMTPTGAAGEFAPLGRGPPTAPPTGGPAPPAAPSSGGLADELSPLANNASGESVASQESVNRTSEEAAKGQGRYMINADGDMTPIPGNADAVDLRAPKGSVIVQRGIGSKPFTIIDRGGLPESHANGLVNRAFGRGLSDEF